MSTESEPLVLSGERFPLLHEVALSALGSIVPDQISTLVIAGIARFGHAGKGDLCFCDRKPAPECVNVPPGAFVLCTPALAPVLDQRFPDLVLIAVDDPRSLFIDFCREWTEHEAIAVSNLVDRPFGVHPTVRIGAHTSIHPETRIDEGAVIGAHCVIHRGSWIQANAIIRDNAVIGVEGINAYRGADGRQRNFPHLAGVIVGERTEIGAGSVVVRGILNSTRIGKDVVIGNLSNIGHVVEIGDKVWMSVGCLIGGHTKIGNGATLGMGVAVRDNIEIGEQSQIGMASVIVKNVRPRVSMFGNPARVIAPIKAGPER